MAVPLDEPADVLGVVVRVSGVDQTQNLPVQFVQSM